MNGTATTDMVTQTNSNVTHIKSEITENLWNTAKEDQSNQGKKMYFIIGGIVGGVPLLCILICVLRAVCSSKQKNANNTDKYSRKRTKVDHN